jgi:hypothetical protein
VNVNRAWFFDRGFPSIGWRSVDFSGGVDLSDPETQRNAALAIGRTLFEEYLESGDLSPWDLSLHADREGPAARPTRTRRAGGRRTNR